MKELVLYGGMATILTGIILNGYWNDSYQEPAPKALEELEDGLEPLLRPVPMSDKFPNIARKSSHPKDWGEDFCGGQYEMS